MRIGLFGGTFNPVHHGHLLLAKAAREQLKLDRVLFIPCAQPPHKSPAGLASGRARLAMIRLAIRGHPAFRASALELSRRGPSYTIDTVRALRRRWPKARLFLLIGQDMLGVRWRSWDELKRLCTVAAARRPHARPPRRERGLVWLAMPQVDIASSEIRRRLRAGRSIGHLVPPAVERYLRRHRFYRRGGTT